MYSRSMVLAVLWASVALLVVTVVGFLVVLAYGAVLGARVGPPRARTDRSVAYWLDLQAYAVGLKLDGALKHLPHRAKKPPRNQRPGPQ